MPPADRNSPGLNRTRLKTAILGGRCLPSPQASHIKMPIRWTEPSAHRAGWQSARAMAPPPPALVPVDRHTTAASSCNAHRKNASSCRPADPNGWPAPIPHRRPSCPRSGRSSKAARQTLWGLGALVHRHVTVKTTRVNEIDPRFRDPFPLLIRYCDQVVRSDSHSVWIAESGRHHLKLLAVG